jgi:hypothetical protein
MKRASASDELARDPTALGSTDEKTKQFALDLLLKGGQGFPIAYAPASVGLNTTQGIFSGNDYSCQTNCAQQGSSTPLWDYADTISWTKGKHAFKGGVDVRFSNSRGYATPTAPIPKATGRAGLNPNQSFQNTSNFPDWSPTIRPSPISFVFPCRLRQQRPAGVLPPESNDLTKWENYLTTDRKWIDTRQNEFSAFFKDDFKVHLR